MSTVKLETVCPKCGTKLNVSADVDNIDQSSVHCGLKPYENVRVYKITTDMMKSFITQKAKMYCPEVKIEMVPRYCEKKRRSHFDPHRSYAFLRIAFSEHIVEKNEDLGWYGKIGESSDNVSIMPSMFQNLFKMYRYDVNKVSEWLSSYKNLEGLEDALGMTEDYINEIRMYAKPQRVAVSGTKESWIIFSAAAENVITDMLTDVNTQKVEGRIEIRDVYPISKENIEFLVYVHPAEVEVYENSHVRQILVGKEKSED